MNKNHLCYFSFRVVVSKWTTCFQAIIISKFVWYDLVHLSEYTNLTGIIPTLLKVLLRLLDAGVNIICVHILFLCSCKIEHKIIGGLVVRLWFQFLHRKFELN